MTRTPEGLPARMVNLQAERALQTRRSPFDLSVLYELSGAYAWLESESRLKVDSELAQIEDRGPAPAGGARREREGERHAVCLSQRLAVTQNVVVAGGRFDGEPGGLEAVDELAYVLPQLRCISVAAWSGT